MPPYNVHVGYGITDAHIFVWRATPPYNVHVGYSTHTFNNLIFFMFIRFPAILLVKTIDSYLHNLIFFMVIRFPAILLVKTIDS